MATYTICKAALSQGGKCCQIYTSNLIKHLKMIHMNDDFPDARRVRNDKPQVANFVSCILRKIPTTAIRQQR